MNKKLTGALAGAMLMAGQTHAIDCSGLPVWQAGATYLGGDQVQHNDNAYEANWWTQDQNPEQYSGQYQEWSLLGDCEGHDPNQPPQGSITSPQNGEIFTENDSVIISVAASDSDGQIVSMEFLLDGASIGTDTAAPWQASWAAAAGSHSLSARIEGGRQQLCHRRPGIAGGGHCGWQLGFSLHNGLTEPTVGAAAGRDRTRKSHES